LDVKLVTACSSEEKALEVDHKHLWDSPEVQLLVGLHVALALAAEPAV